MAARTASHQDGSNVPHADVTSEELMSRLHAITAEHARRENVADEAFPDGELPPDIVQARVERHAAMNNEVARMFRTRPSSEPGAPVSLRGLGKYTHVELPAQAPMFPHQQYTRPKPAFLPLGGPHRQCTGVRAAPEVPAPVKETYAKLREVLLQEEQLDDGWNPGSRFEALPVPDATTVGAYSNQGDVEMGDADGSHNVVDHMRTLSNKRRRPSVGGGMQLPIRGDERRVSNAGGDVALGGVAPSTGTIYDASRDPRKRARNF